MTKRLIALALAPVAIAVIAFAMMGAGSSEARQTPSPSTVAAAVNQVQACSDGDASSQEGCGGYPVYECFWVLSASGEAANPNEWVELYTQSNGEDRVVVRQLIWLCESGYKFSGSHDGGAGSADADAQGGKKRVFACYRIAYGDIVYDTETLWTDNFGYDNVLIRGSEIMCDKAKKYHNETVTGSLDDDDVEASGSRGSSVWQCFTLNALPKWRIFGIWTKNFDWQKVWALNGYQLCEDASKYHNEEEHGDATGNIRECFRIEQMNPYWLPQTVELDTKNFGEVRAVIGRPALMCEYAEWSRNQEP
ncbi:MAG: hypothetical protein AB7L91_03245 [Dehalococcoidia bacterium]